MQNRYRVIALMSGTSLDGVDIAYITYNKSSNWHFEMHQTITIPYCLSWQKKLKTAALLPDKKLYALDVNYTLFLSELVNQFIAENHLKEIDFISSHGHTIFHQPNKGITLQIGNLPIFAEKTKKIVIGNFRKQDVALGGQGAPLVPIGDRLLFSNYAYCLNLGGFANISYEVLSQRIAFDICPVNVVLNHLSAFKKLPFDNHGEMAKQGELIAPLLDQLNHLSYYKKDPPKSLGIEWVQKNIFPLLNPKLHPISNLLHTYTEHIAQKIGKTIPKDASVLVTGGGAFNKYLAERLKYYKEAAYEIPNSEIIQFKEAVVFGLLGVLKFRDEINCLSSVTGAIRDHSAGEIFLP